MTTNFVNPCSIGRRGGAMAVAAVGGAGVGVEMAAVTRGGGQGPGKGRRDPATTGPAKPGSRPSRPGGGGGRREQGERGGWGKKLLGQGGCSRWSHGEESPRECGAWEIGRAHV